MNNDDLVTNSTNDQANEPISVPEVDTTAPVASVQLGDEPSNEVISVPEVDTTAPMATVQEGLTPNGSNNDMSSVQKTFNPKNDNEE